MKVKENALSLTLRYQVIVELVTRKKESGEISRRVSRFEKGNQDMINVIVG